MNLAQAIVLNWGCERSPVIASTLSQVFADKEAAYLKQIAELKAKLNKRRSQKKISPNLAEIQALVREDLAESASIDESAVYADYLKGK